MSELDVIAVAIIAKVGDAGFCESNLLVKSGCEVGSGVEEGGVFERSSVDSAVLWGSDELVDVSEEDEVEFSKVSRDEPVVAKLMFATKYFK